MMDRGVRFLRRLFQVAGAFFRLGFQSTISYPLTFLTNQLGAFVPAVLFFFVAKLIDRPLVSHGGDYYTYVIIGLVGLRILDTGIRGFTQELDLAINRGWLEMYLVEPVRWRFLPFGMAQWPIIQGVISAGIIALIGLALGAEVRWQAIPLALAILALGLAAGMAIGILSGALKVLAKTGDPIIFAYSLAAQLLSGVYFSTQVLPEPLRWLSWLLPHTYVIHGLRRVLMAEGPRLGGMEHGTAMLLLVGFCALAYPLGLWLYGRALEFGRKLGVLSGY
ncbi:MAG: ABC transporter permease [Acidimicrobiia bacterium]